MIENLQFLRPDWFYAFIPLAIFIVLMLRRHSSNVSWKAVCDEQLLPYVLTQTSNKTSALPLWLSSIVVSLCIIAAAGPAWEKLPQPVFREQSALVIMLDLSKSMDATDLKPSRIQRAKLKILDMLEARKGGQTALIVYAADAFVVTPLTDDVETIINLVPTLETDIMPAQGSNAGSAIEKATALLKQAGTTKGELLLITDGASETITSQIKKLNNADHRLSILGVGTSEGSPIPMNGGFLQDANGAIVIPKLKPQQLRNIASSGGGTYVNLQTNDSDTEQLVRLFNSKRIKSNTEETQLTADIWQEEGPWLLLIVLPFAALWSRKGWLLVLPVTSSMLLTATLLSLSEPAYAIDTDNLWSSPDQKAMRSFNNGDAAQAAELFEQERWKSSAYYRSGDYENAINTLKQPTSSDDFYNKGNALAKLGRYPEAINAYNEALKLDENNDDASFNRELVKKKIEQQDAQQENKQDDNGSPDNQKESDQQNQSDGNDSDDKQESPGAEQHSGNEKENAQPDNQETPDNEEKNAEENSQTRENMANEEKENENSEESEDSQSLAMQDNEMSEEDQATEQWLKRIPDDPGGLLRRKFIYQYKRMPHKADKQPW